VRNPWGRRLVPGGSSGGAAGRGGGAHGAGRDRHRYRRLDPPAGRVERDLRPQANLRRVSRYGMVGFASSLDQGGPLAKSGRRTWPP